MMGVSCILLWEPPEGNPSQAMDFLQRRLELLGGKPLGVWTVDCETLHSTQALAAGGQKLIHMLHSSEYPRTTFAVLDTMKCLVADNSLDSIFNQLKAFYAPRKGLKIEVKGSHYEVKQYMVKYGSVTIGSANKGIIVEVEDQQSSSVVVCWGPLTEFIKGLLSYSQNLDPPSFARQSDRPYTRTDSMIHYAYIFTELRKPPGSATSALK